MTSRLSRTSSLRYWCGQWAVRLTEFTPPSDYYILAHWCYRSSDVQFSSAIADVLCPNQPNSSNIYVQTANTNLGRFWIDSRMLGHDLAVGRVLRPSSWLQPTKPVSNWWRWADKMTATRCWEIYNYLFVYHNQHQNSTKETEYMLY